MQKFANFRPLTHWMFTAESTCPFSSPSWHRMMCLKSCTIDFMLYAPAILLGILVLMLATGALKVIVGVLLSTVNPLIAALYTFFFANIIGKQVTKAIFTTVLMTACAYVLDYLQIAYIPFSNDALIIFVPCLLIILVIWRILRKIF